MNFFYYFFRIYSHEQHPYCRSCKPREGGLYSSFWRRGRDCYLCSGSSELWRRALRLHGRIRATFPHSTPWSRCWTPSSWKGNGKTVFRVIYSIAVCILSILMRPSNLIAMRLWSVARRESGPTTTRVCATSTSPRCLKRSWVSTWCSSPTSPSEEASALPPLSRFDCLFSPHRSRSPAVCSLSSVWESTWIKRTVRCEPITRSTSSYRCLAV